MAARWWQWWVTEPLGEWRARSPYRITRPIKAVPPSFCVDPVTCNRRTEPRYRRGDQANLIQRTQAGSPCVFPNTFLALLLNHLWIHDTNRSGLLHLVWDRSAVSSAGTAATKDKILLTQTPQKKWTDIVLRFNTQQGLINGRHSLPHRGRVRSGIFFTSSRFLHYRETLQGLGFCTKAGSDVWICCLCCAFRTMKSKELTRGRNHTFGGFLLFNPILL